MTDMMDCPNCDGYGWSYNPETAATDAPCARCQGSGQVPLVLGTARYGL